MVKQSSFGLPGQYGRRVTRVNTADSSAHGKANPCGHIACIFVRKTAGCIDSRLTLRKLHLATNKLYNLGHVLEIL